MSLVHGRKGHWISTATGRKFWPFDPRPEEIFIEDIAHASSLINRYNGHSLWAYSIAQHCVLVASKCKKKNKLWGLLHEMDENFGLSDLNGHAKQRKEFASYRKVAKKIQKAGCIRFGLEPKEPKEVKMVDKRMLYTEARVLIKNYSEWDKTWKPYNDVAIERWTPEKAETEFLKMFYELGGKYAV